MSVRVGHQDKHVTVLYPDPIDPRCPSLKFARYRGTTSGISIQLQGPRGGFRSTKWVASLTEYVPAVMHLLREGHATLGKPAHTRIYLSRSSYVDPRDDLVSFHFVGPKGGHHGKASISLADFVSVTLTMALPPYAVPIPPTGSVLLDPVDVLSSIESL